MWRRPILALLLCPLTACGANGAPDTAPAAPDQRPNVIFILVDDQRHDAFGVMTPGLETPALDRLITEGLHFTNAFVTTSLCSPSRASIMTSQTMRTHGVVDNNSPTPEDFEPFAVLLDSAGYDTAFIGKWHMGNDDASPKPGFDHWVSFEGQGNYAPVDAFGRPSLFNVNGEEVPQQGYITDELTDYALGWLEGRGSDPYFLFLSHKAVHLPFTPAERHAGQYDGLEIALPQSNDLAGRTGQVPMWLHVQRNSWSGSDFTYYSDRPMRDFQRDYYAALSAVDEGVAKLIGSAAGPGNGRDTVIIYSSDNGFMFGEHGLIDKRAAYEASIRVPLIIHAPERLGEGREVSAIARNIDIAPTILALAGLEAPDHYEGRDLLAEGAANEPLVYEYYWEFNYPQTPSTFALRDERYKYIQYHGVWDTEELFDLQADPHELHNLIDDPAHLERVVRMRSELFSAISPEGRRPSIPFTPRYNQGAVFWSNAYQDHMPFAPEWERDPAAPDKYEHLIPDGREKDQQLRAITPAVRAILDEGPSQTQGDSP